MVATLPYGRRVGNVISCGNVSFHICFLWLVYRTGFLANSRYLVFHFPHRRITWSVLEIAPSVIIRVCPASVKAERFGVIYNGVKISLSRGEGGVGVFCIYTVHYLPTHPPPRFHSNHQKYSIRFVTTDIKSRFKE